MSIVTLLPEVNVAVSGNSTTTYVNYWLTGWMPCIAMDSALSTLKIVNCVNNVEVVAAVQFATCRIDKPSAPTEVGTVRTSDNEYQTSTTDYGIAATAPGNTYVRFGVACKVSQAGQGRADVAFQLSFVQRGTLIAPWTGHLLAPGPTKIFVPVSGWLPAIGVVKVRATITIGDIANNLQLVLTTRVASTSPEAPDAWDPTGLITALAANGETTSTAEITVAAAAGKAWLQFGLWHNQSTGTNVGQADVTVLLGIRQAT